MNSLITRILSALAAVIVLFSLFYFLKDAGLKLLIVFAVLVGTWELNRVLFSKEKGSFHFILFYFFNLIIFSLSCWLPEHSGIFFSAFFVLFSVITIVRNRANPDLPHIEGLQAKAAMGFFYVGLLPSFAYQLLNVRQGVLWFLTMLCIVFAGDIGAYAAGLLLGEKKVMPLISPKKTFAGAIGGLLFSVVAGLSCSFLFPAKPMLYFIFLSLITAIVAQFGDYFESLLKRVADVKDSGGLMPGHGGVLDRIDGVLFACPIFLLGAILLEKLV